MKKKNESGRSMVEMLGVLAIIGVLSVGGISGYKMAMNQHQTNKILSTLDTSMMLLGTALRTSDKDKITINVNNEMDIYYTDGWVELRKKGTDDLFYFPFNKEICKNLAHNLDVTKWDYWPHEKNICGGNVFITVADGFSSYYEGEWGSWGGVNCQNFDSGEYEDGYNVSTSTRLSEDCDKLTGDTLTFYIGA